MTLYGFMGFCAVYLLAVATPGPGVAAVLTLGNPKAMIFFVALLPAVVQLQTFRLTDYLLIAVAITVILPLVLGGYAWAASRARRFFRKPNSIQLLNRGAGTAMAGAAIAVAVQ